MKRTLQAIDKFHETSRGRYLFAAAELLLAFALVSLAIDSGAIWQYLLATIFFVGGVRNFVNAIRVAGHGKGKRK